jgi:enoyl-CoA hydratase/carnithine racemase
VSDLAPPILVETADGLMIITIARPEVKNAINYAAAEAIAHALEQLDADDTISVGIITGSGGGFSSGMDLAAFLKGSKPSYGDRGFAGMTRRSAAKPLIAAVEGFAIAGGFEIALACDMIVAAEGARFELPEVRRGLVAAAGALLRLPRRMPYHAVMELALTGEPITAERLHHFGVVNRVVRAGSALAEAIMLARRVMEGGPLAVAATKRILVEQQDWTLETMWREQEPIFRSVAASDDAQEGARAFKERRPPQWQRR